MNKFFDEYGKNPHELHFNAENMLRIGSYDNNLILDLYDIFVSICYHDFFTIRDENVDNSSKLKITVPVNYYDELEKVIPIICELIAYMTNGEKWSICIEKSIIPKKIDTGRLELQTEKFENICLLSGGLDAFSGALNEKDNKTLFVTTETNPTEVINARFIYDHVLNESQNEHVVVKKKELNYESHYTQRTRTLFFLSNALIYADYFKISEIKMYENGIMSLNPKFYFRRIVTKTTHPKTIYLINKILNELNINIKIINPYMYLTKSEVLSRIPKKYIGYIKNTKTCSKNHGIQALSNRAKGETHCGLCTACILRQISILNSNLIENDAHYMLPLKMRKREDIVNYEKQISKPNKSHLVNKYAIYKYIEKKSLLEYYERYYDLVITGNIYNYLDLNPKFFEEKDYFDRIDKMIKKFAKEIKKYLDSMEK